ncbi:MAG: hypothetical protein GX075_11590 [Firmicutes bacterium]|nr:hypothetical protein [Bacillota bacterium]
MLKRFLIVLLIGIFCFTAFLSGCIAGEEGNVLSAAKKHTLSIATYPDTIKFLEKSLVKKISSDPNQYMVILYLESMANQFGDKEKRFIVYLVNDESKGNYRFDGFDGTYQGAELPSNVNDLFKKYVQGLSKGNVESFKEVYTSNIFFSVKGELHEEVVSKEKRLVLWEKLSGIWQKEGFRDCEIIDIYKIADNQYELIICYVPNDYRNLIIVHDKIGLAITEDNKKIKIWKEDFSDNWVQILYKCDFTKIIKPDPLTVEDFHPNYKGLKLGISADEVIKLLGKPKQNIQINNFIEVYNYPQITVWVNYNFKDHEVYEYSIEKEDIKTSRGVGVGDFAADVISRYGKQFKVEDGWLQYSLKTTLDGNGNKFVYYYEFLIEEGRVKEMKCGQAMSF